VRQPSDKSPEPPGGRAAERLREFRRQRDPQDQAAADDKQVDSGPDDTQGQATPGRVQQEYRNTK